MRTRFATLQLTNPMAVFTLKIDTARKYLALISGVTRLTPSETEVLAEIIDFMQLKNLHVVDDQVKEHVLRKFKFHQQTYHNMLHIFRKKKLLVHSHKKTELKPHLLPGTVLEIKFEGARSVLETYNDTPTVNEKGKTKTGQHKRRAVPASS